MPPLNDREFFQSLNDKGTPKGVLGFSLGLHGILLFLLILVPLVAPQTLHVNYRGMLLAPPPEQPRHLEPLHLVAPPRVSSPRLTPRQPELIAEIPVAVPRVVTLVPENRAVESIPKPLAPPIAVSAPSLIDAVPTPTLAPPRPPVITNVFSTTTPVAATAAPERNMEAAGFGAANANREVSHTGKAESTAPAGFGDSNGSREHGRPSRTEGVGAVSGFDSGISGGTRVAANPGTVTTAGFTPVNAPKTQAPASKIAEPVSNEKPVEIVLKPRPDYTDEARKMRVEGEVLLRVLFTSSGEVHNLEVLRGLGHGLNENAIRAAEHIHFKPAERSGQPVDSTAIVHIVFQLAY